MTPDQVKYALMNRAEPAIGTTVRQLQLKDIQKVSVTGVAPQNHARSTGTGSLELARGGSHVADPDTGQELRGERDIFGQTWDGTRWAAASLAGQSWRGGTWNGSTWTGDGWTGNSWRYAHLDGCQLDGPVLAHRRLERHDLDRPVLAGPVLALHQLAGQQLASWGVEWSRLALRS